MSSTKEFLTSVTKINSYITLVHIQSAVFTTTSTCKGSCYNILVHCKDERYQGMKVT